MITEMGTGLPGERLCKGCEHILPLGLFHRDKNKNDGRTYYCKDCSYSKVKAWRRANPSKHAAQLRRRATKRPDLRRDIARRRRARVEDAYVENVSELVVLEMDDGACGICGEDVDPLAFEVDHIIPIAHGGLHEYPNVQVAHSTCNRIKSDFF